VPGKILTTALLAILILPAFVSCSRTNSGDIISLDFVPQNTANAREITGFDIKGNFVLRCASLVDNENGIVIETSKSKFMKANVLIFVKPIEPGESVVQIAVATITGKEYEYDLARARFYLVSPSSASKAIETYGIPYLDWQTGACSTSEQFPCCE